jgi:hypothetical protein
MLRLLSVPFEGGAHSVLRFKGDRISYVDRLFVGCTRTRCYGPAPPLGSIGSLFLARP